MSTITPESTCDRRGVTVASAGIVLRADPAGGQRFKGHAAVFNSRTAIGNPLTWGFYEEIADGAFTKTLAEGDARMLIDHSSYHVVSRVSAGTLELAQDRRGLAVDSALDQEVTYVADLVRNLDNENITGMSFGFYVIKDEWWTEEVELSDGNSAEVEVRRLLELRLVEVSAVTFPAYEDTDAGLRDRVRAEDEVAAVRSALGRRTGGRALLEARSLFCPGLAPARDAAAPAEPAGPPTPDDAGPPAEPGTEPGSEPGTETPGTAPGADPTEEPVDTTPAGETDEAHDDGGEPAETTPPTDADRAHARMRSLRALIPT